MKHLGLLAARLVGPGVVVGPGVGRIADSRGLHSPEQAALESHLDALHERLGDLERTGGSAKAGADTRLQLARTLVGLRRGDEAWSLGREAFNYFLAADDFESAADACDVLFQAEQPGSICALGQGIWLAVTCPVDPELSIDLLSHVIDETPDDADGAAVAASTALFLADVRAQGKHRDDLMFFSTQTLGQVARRHSGVQTPEQFDRWMERLELKEPDKFLPRLRNVVEALVRDDWWFDRDALQDRLPFGLDHNPGHCTDREAVGPHNGPYGSRPSYPRVRGADGSRPAETMIKTLPSAADETVNRSQAKPTLATLIDIDHDLDKKVFIDQVDSSLTNLKILSFLFQIREFATSCVSLDDYRHATVIFRKWKTFLMLSGQVYAQDI